MGCLQTLHFLGRSHVVVQTPLDTPRTAKLIISSNEIQPRGTRTWISDLTWQRPTEGMLSRSNPNPSWITGPAWLATVSTKCVNTGKVLTAQQPEGHKSMLLLVLDTHTHTHISQMEAHSVLSLTLPANLRLMLESSLTLLTSYLNLGWAKLKFYKPW